MTDLPIYLDYNATTPVDPAVTEAMLPYLTEHFGNPSSRHLYGTRAREGMERAREQVAALIGATADGIVFTASGSESNNLALKGVMFHVKHFRRAQLITSAVEHPAVARPCAFLERLGCRVTVVPVDRWGRVDPAEVERALTPETALVSIMHANNEVGTLQPIAEIAAVCRRRGVLVHTDASQSVGKVPVDVDRLGVDLLTIAGHKVYAPKGIGALFVRRGLELEPLVHGAAHESGRRAGTENVPYMVGLGKACELAAEHLAAGESQRLRRLRDRLWRGLREALGEKVSLNGPADAGGPEGEPADGLPNTLNVNFAGLSGTELMDATPDVAASTGAACHTGRVSLSGTLRAMGVPPERGRGAVRLSLGRFTTEADVDRAVNSLAESWRRLTGVGRREG